MLFIRLISLINSIGNQQLKIPVFTRISTKVSCKYNRLNALGAVIGSKAAAKPEKTKIYVQ
jgi:hypothetical protein